jgi:hypothetical protein
MAVLLVELLALTLWPVLAGGLLMAVAWGICALLSIGRGVGSPGDACDYRVATPPSTRVEQGSSNVTRLSEWRTRRGVV